MKLSILAREEGTETETLELGKACCFTGRERVAVSGGIRVRRER